MATRTISEENYLKSIYSLSKHGLEPVSTNGIAQILNTKPSSVTEMLKRLATKRLLKHQRYKGVHLTAEGKRIAINIIRKHRLWEYFLVEKLNFSWTKVHEVAEQLEHIQSSLLINKLDQFLDHPQYDPHGDPIPNEKGEFVKIHDKTISRLNENDESVVVGVKDHTALFLDYLDKVNLNLGSKIKVINYEKYDDSMLIEINKKQKVLISKDVSRNVYVK